MDSKQQIRQARLRLMTLASLEALKSGLANFSNINYEFIRPPESGLIMVRGRQGNTGSLFNIGEMLITRCTLKCQDIVGQAWVTGQDKEKAVLVALGDALSQNPDHQSALEGFFQQLEGERGQMVAAENKEIAATKVNFITMVRGEDKDD